MAYKAVASDSRSLYEILNTEKGATPAEIKKAYRKRALRLHPDKQKLNPTEGAEEEFLKVNTAYNILSNANARRAYDSFGLQAAIGTIDPSQTDPSSFFTSLSFSQAICFILLIIAVCGFFALSPILISLRWDDQATFSWVAAFIPILILQTCFVGLVLVFQCPTLTEPTADEETPSMGTIFRRVLSLVSLLSSILLFATLEVLVGLKLDGSVSYSWIVALTPWIILECIGTLGDITTSGEEYRDRIKTFMSPMEPEEEVELKNRTLMTDLNFLVYFLGILVSRACRLALVAIIASKLDGDITVTWWAAFTPVWILFGYKAFCGSLGCFGIFFGMSPRLPAGMPEEEADAMRRQQRCVAPLCICICLLGPIFAFTALFVSKLQSDSVPAGVIFIPFFIAIGCCCLISSLALCMLACKPGAEEADSTYGTGSGATNSDTPYTRAEEGMASVPGAGDAASATREAEAAPAPATAPAEDDADISDID